MFEYRRSYLDTTNHVDCPSDSGSCSDLESPFESSAAKPPFSDTTPTKVTTVEISGQTYRAPSCLSKQFYLDLTYMTDDELISTYTLVKYIRQERNSSFWAFASMKDLKR